MCCVCALCRLRAELFREQELRAMQQEAMHAIWDKVHAHANEHVHTLSHTHMHTHARTHARTHAQPPRLTRPNLFLADLTVKVRVLTTTVAEVQRREQTRAAIVLQKHVRAWLIRKVWRLVFAPGCTINEHVAPLSPCSKRACTHTLICNPFGLVVVFADIREATEAKAPKQHDAAFSK